MESIGYCGLGWLGDADQFGKFIVEYTEKWGKVIRTAGIKAD